MNTRWGWLTRFGILLGLLAAGCRTPQPDLKPAKQPEVFNTPPNSVVSNNSYPKQAFNDDPAKKLGLDPGKLQQAGSTMAMPPSMGNFGGPGLR
jgi:hypothetical protein